MLPRRLGNRCIGPVFVDGDTQICHGYDEEEMKEEEVNPILQLHKRGDGTNTLGETDNERPSISRTGLTAYLQNPSLRTSAQQTRWEGGERASEIRQRSLC